MTRAGRWPGEPGSQLTFPLVLNVHFFFFSSSRTTLCFDETFLFRVIIAAQFHIRAGNYDLHESLYICFCQMLWRGEYRRKKIASLRCANHLEQHATCNCVRLVTCRYRSERSGLRGLFWLIVVQSLSHVWLFVTPWSAAHQASLSFTISWSLLRLSTYNFMWFDLEYHKPSRASLTSRSSHIYCSSSHMWPISQINIIYYTLAGSWLYCPDSAQPPVKCCVIILNQDPRPLIWRRLSVRLPKASQWSYFLLSSSYIICTTCVGAGSSGLLLTNTTQGKWKEVISQDRLYETDCVLLAFCLASTLAHFLSLLACSL